MVLIDPYLTRASLGRFVLAPLRPDLPVIRRHVLRADAVIAGHTHFDHVLDVPAIARMTGATVFGSRSTVTLCRAQGVPESQIRDVQRPASSEPVVTESGPFRLTFVPSTHSRFLFGRVPFPGRMRMRLARPKALAPPSDFLTAPPPDGHGVPAWPRPPGTWKVARRAGDRDWGGGRTEADLGAAVDGADGAACIVFDVTSGKVVLEPRARARGLAASPSAEHLATIAPDRSLQLESATRCVQVVPYHEGGPAFFPTRVGFSTDSSTLVVQVSRGESAWKAWDTRTGALRYALVVRGHEGEDVQPLFPLPDLRIVSGYAGAPFRLLERRDVKTGAPCRGPSRS